MDTEDLGCGGLTISYNGVSTGGRGSVPLTPPVQCCLMVNCKPLPEFLAHRNWVDSKWLSLLLSFGVICNATID